MIESRSPADTLDELDRVPAVDTMVVAPEDAAKFAEATKPKKTRSRVIPALLLILIALAIVAVVLWTLHNR